MLNRRIILFPFLFLLVALFALFFAQTKGILFLAKLTILISVASPILWIGLGKIIGEKRRKSFVANLILAGVAISTCLIVAEVFVRHLYQDVTTTGDYTSFFTHRWISKHPPVINEFGFREREITKQKAANVYRIVIVGDSFTYGQGILDEARFTRVIELRLNSTQSKEARNYEVLNFGKPGAATVDHIDFLDQIFELDPDFILLQWLPNDVEGHDLAARPKAYRLIPSDYVSGWLHRNSALFYIIKTGLNVLQIKLGLVESYSDSMFERFADPESKDSLRASREMDEFIHRVKDRNIPLGIVMFPSLIDTGGEFKNFAYGFLFDRVIDACDREAIQCLDMRLVLAGVSPASKLWLHQFDAHPSPLTNELAAEAIMEEFGKTW